jgi:TonB family protein
MQGSIVRATLAWLATGLFVAAVNAADRNFELLIVRPFQEADPPRVFVVVGGGYEDGLEDGMTATLENVVAAGLNGTLRLENVEQFEAAGIITQTSPVSTGDVRNHLRSGDMVGIEVPSLDSAALYQKAIQAMGAGDYCRARCYLKRLAERYDAGSSITLAIKKCGRQLEAERSQPLAGEDLRLAKAKLPIDIQLMERYFRRGQYAHAAEKAEAVLRTEPGNARAKAIKVDIARIDSVLTARAATPSAPKTPESPGATMVTSEEAQPAAPATDTSVIVKPEMTYEEEPAYPQVARQHNITGTVWIKALVDEEGNVAQAFVDEPSGSQLLDKAALEAAYKNKYKPGTRDGEPFRTWVRYEVTFKQE